MPEEWTGNLIGRMHNERVTYDDLAAEIGCSKAYISMILNGRRNTANAEKTLNDAFNSVIKKRKDE